MNETGKSLRLPAEWEDYDDVMIAWPHAGTDWAPMLDEVTDCYVSLTAAIVRDSGLRAVIVTPEPERVRTLVSALPSDRILIVKVPTNDTWTRDYGPLTVRVSDERGQETTAVCDFKFNGWGLKFASDLDNMVNLRLYDNGLLTRSYLPRLGFVLEGGAVETDGEGVMLTTAACQYSLNRNGLMNRTRLEMCMKEYLGMHTVHILEHGHLEGDDTDSHIDTLARLAPGNTILYVKSYNPSDSHTPELDLMERELAALRTPAGEPYNLIALPLPDPICDEEGERLPATYANFLITPRTVLMPVYGQPQNDTLAEQMLRIAFPDRKIVTVDCRALIRQHGSLHCATMQLPPGALRS